MLKVGSVYSFLSLAFINLLFQIPSTVVHSFEKRDYVIKELLETEKNYVDVLGSLQKYFMKPLSNLLRPEDMKVIFGGIKVVSSSH